MFCTCGKIYFREVSYAVFLKDIGVFISLLGWEFPFSRKQQVVAKHVELKKKNTHKKHNTVEVLKNLE